MENFNMSKNTTFYALGLSYKKADASIRGKFSLDTKAQADLLVQAKAEGIEALIVTSTCNRTEIYGYANHPYELIKLLCDNSKGSVQEFQEVAYIYKNQDAINHMFRVGTGLDSQILGDFEIIGQIKTSFEKTRNELVINKYGVKVEDQGDAYQIPPERFNDYLAELDGILSEKESIEVQPLSISDFGDVELPTSFFNDMKAFVID